MDGLAEQFGKSKISDERKVKFILNVPMYVPYDSTANEPLSSGEDYETDDEFKALFEKIDVSKKQYPYRSFQLDRGKPTRRVGKIVKQGCYLNQSEQGQTVASNSLPQKFLRLLEEEGFRDSDRESGRVSDLGVIIGLNRPRSLSDRRNNCLHKQNSASEQSKIAQYKKFAFYWEVPWTDSAGVPVSYERVRKFYKQLKKRKPNWAKQFLEYNEDKMKPSPPYQHIRDEVSKHNCNTEFIQAIRKDVPNAVIYVSFVDSDSICFNGIYSAYLELIEERGEFPNVMSTGYQFSAEGDGNYPLYVGSKLERLIRVTTAKAFGPGVYYPEPNFCVLLEPKCNILQYSFVDTKQRDGKMESPILLRPLLQNQDCVCVFSEKSALFTSANRAQDSRLKFSEDFMTGGAPNRDDKTQMLQIIQSTLNPKQWAEALYYNRAFKLHGNPGVKGKFVGLMSKLCKNEDVNETLLQLNVIVTPNTAVPQLHKAAKDVSYIIERFFNVLESDKVANNDVYCGRTDEFYQLSVSSMLAVIDLFDKYKDKCYFAINHGYSLYNLCQIYIKDRNAVKHIFSEQAQNYIFHHNIHCFEDITYEDLEELYFAIIKHGGNEDDYTEMITNETLLNGNEEEYAELTFNDVKEMLFYYIQEDTGSESAECYQSAFEKTMEYFYNEFHVDDKDEDSDTNEYDEDEDSDTNEDEDSDTYNYEHFEDDTDIN